METARVNICYRPLRIAFAIHSADRASLRRAIRLTHTFWSGRFNPIVFADRPDEARQLIELFRADHIVALGDAPEVSALRDGFPHLLSPYFPNELFLDHKGENPYASVLDVQNAFAHCQGKPAWTAAKEKGFRRILWDEDDPLADAFLMQYGAYPNPSETGIDYAAIYAHATGAIDLRFDKTAVIPEEIPKHPAVGYLSRHAIERHHGVGSGWSYPGFFVGDAASMDDLVACWNLRAADIPISFIDLLHASRYASILPYLKEGYQELVASRPNWNQRLAIWSIGDDKDKFKEAIKLLGEGDYSYVRIAPPLWNGLNVRPPMMMLGEASAMGVVGERQGTTVSFTLNDKPFAGDFWFHTQHLVASLDIWGNYGDQQAFRLPYLPELNEAAARSMEVQFDRMRIEPGRIGVVIDAADHDLRLSAFPVPELIEKTFALAGLKAAPSSSGLIARQLIARLGGYDGARVFKVPGVRRLIKTHGPTATFTKRTALQLIGQTDPHSGARFEEHEDLYIEQRPVETKLTPNMVFEYLVEKGLFRIGAEIECPSCSLPSWIPLDTLRQTNTCELCGDTFDATRQLVRGEFRYRRTGVLGIEKNTQGAIPVALLLQQLEVNLYGIGGALIQSPSYDLAPLDGVGLPRCETDFVTMCLRTYPHKNALIIGECKDEGCRIEANDVENLKQVANAIPAHRFDTYVLLARLSPFTEDEIALARTLNDEYRQRVILLSARELEPYHLYERVERDLGIDSHGGSPAEMAKVTARMYFTAPLSTSETDPAKTNN